MLNEKFQLFLQEYLRLNAFEERNKYGYVLEGCETSPEDCHRLFQNGDNLIYYLGSIYTNAEDFFKKYAQMIHLKTGLSLYPTNL